MSKPSGMRRPSFSRDDRARLRELGVLEQQIHRLEAAFPLCLAMLKQPAPMADVRAEMSEMSVCLQSTRRPSVRVLALFADELTSVYGDACVAATV